MYIRKLRQDDNLFEISNVYEKSWKVAYNGIIPDTYLQSIKIGNWISNLNKDDRQHLVMIENNHIIGTSSYCNSRFAEFDGWGEIISIYLLPEYMGKGYGKALLNRALFELGKLGYTKIFLWVLEGNDRAIKFYEKGGFQQMDHYLQDNIGGKELREISYCYQIKTD